MHDPSQTISDTGRILRYPSRITNEISIPSSKQKRQKNPPNQNRINFPNFVLVLSYPLFKPLTSNLLCTLYQKHQINPQRPLSQQLRCSARDGHDRAFVICHSTSVEVAVPTCEGEGVGRPGRRWGGYDVVMGVEEDSGTGVGFGLGTSKCS